MEEKEIFRKFRRNKLILYCGIASALLGAAIFGIGATMTNNVGFFAIFLFVGFALWIVSFLFYRCPKCLKWFDPRSRGFTFCAFCGTQLVKKNTDR